MARMSNIQEIVTRLIQGGHVLQCEKTKSLRDGGKQAITVGKYGTATNDPRKAYAMFRYHGSQQWEEYGIAAIDIAQSFIAFVGRDIARRTARDYIISRSLKPQAYGVKVSYDFANNCEVW